ncbi:hypothetical protein Ais01nite_40570 [Asanoa ishikariensis]|uniref:DUF4328 domain-containing protein n=1 Tax=Asanoa ishikariensis TaxID=137265 RepID=A0A1H3MAV1_9ACTN|nr:DUF4328 domain-containing protein [Asanoa ishikariensis]GIF66022.1 hypothetical protein Ais01nite_40570 [Asanoa ishikariensis]SDY73852.1 protein of unknown function [Asanoa ishikariensis]
MNQFVYEGHRTYRNRGVGVAAIIVVGLTALALVVAAVLFWAIKISIGQGGYAGDLETASNLERFAEVADLAFAVGQFPALVLTVIWLWRARKNLDAFPDTKPSLAAGWTIGGWFFPIANLFVPGRMMANAVRESTRNRWVTRVAIVWWIALLVAMVANRFGNVWAENALYSDISDIAIVSDYYRELARANTVAAAAGLIAAAAFAFVVSRTSAAQEDRIYRGWYEAQNRALTAPADAPTAFVGSPAQERWDPAASSGTGQETRPVGAGPDPTASPGTGQGTGPVGAGPDPTASRGTGQGTGLVGAGPDPVGSPGTDPVIGVTPRAAAPDGDGSATIGA